MFEKFLNLVKQLYPTGRAWKMWEGSLLERLHIAINETFEDAFNDLKAIFDSMFPDNANFTAQDASDWERRLGMIESTASLVDRKAAILRKMQYPGRNPAKSHYLYIEKCLRDAGFDVYVYENMFPLYPTGYETKEPIDLLPLGYYMQLGDGQLGDGQLGDKTTYYNNYITYMQLGNFQLGDVQLNEYVWSDRVINNIEQEKDLKFNLNGNNRATIFIGGSPLGTFANVPIARKEEFRQLIIKLKNTHIIAFLFINYV